MSAETILTALRLRSPQHVAPLSRACGITLEQCRSSVAELQLSGRVTHQRGYVNLVDHAQQRAVSAVAALEARCLSELERHPDQRERELLTALGGRAADVTAALERLERRGMVRRFGSRLRAVPAATEGLEQFATEPDPEQQLLNSIAQTVRDQFPNGVTLRELALTVELTQLVARDACAQLIDQGVLTCERGIYSSLTRRREQQQLRERQSLDELLGVLGVVRR